MTGARHREAVSREKLAVHSLKESGFLAMGADVKVLDAQAHGEGCEAELINATCAPLSSPALALQPPSRS